VRGVAFAPSGDTLALEGAKGVSLVEQTASRRIADANIEAFGWHNGRLAVAVPGSNSAVIRLFTPDGAARGSFRVDGIVRAITPKFIVVQRKRDLVTGHTTLLTVPQGASVRTLELG
jgi:hypothetical protein